MPLADVNPSSWMEADAARWDSYQTVCQSALEALEPVEQILEQLGQQSQLAEIRSTQGLLRMSMGTFAGRARSLRAQAADRHGLPMSATVRRVR